MNKKLFSYLLFVIVVIVACKKKGDETAPATLNLPEPDPAVIEHAYPLVTAANSIFLVSGTVYRVNLMPYASFFTFDRSMPNGDLYYRAISESKNHFIPFKFYIADDGSGRIVAIAMPTEPEIAWFYREWEQP